MEAFLFFIRNFDYSLAMIINSFHLIAIFKWMVKTEWIQRQLNRTHENLANSVRNENKNPRTIYTISEMKLLFFEIELKQ